MGSSESTGRSNGTEEEEERQPENNNSGGGSMGAGTAIAVAAGTAVAAWSISRMISGSTDTESKEKDDVMKIKAHGMDPSLPNFRPSEGMSCSIWSPAPGRFKMNTDGGCLVQDDGQGPSGYGGILRDDRGNWVRGFRGFIGVTDSLTAEFYGILKGLELLDKLGLQESILETDCQAAKQWVERRDDDRGKRQIIHDAWNTIEKSRQLALKNNITINHIGDKANKCAHKLADMAIEKQEEYVEIEDLPYEIKDLVDQESKSFNR